MPTLDIADLDSLTGAIVAAVQPSRIYLFGSRARGEARPDSDVDLLVIEKEPFGPNRSRRLETQKIYHALADFPLPKDIIVCSEADLDYWRDSLNNVAARALREGVLLYERS